MKAKARIVSVLCVALALAGCGRRPPEASYRYKLTLSVNTPGGAKTASTVVEDDYPTSHLPYSTTGQALYLDLGPGKKPLIALLGHLRRQWEVNGKHAVWGYDSPLNIIWRACGMGVSGHDDVEDIRLINARCNDAYQLTAADLPDLVTFADVNDPKSLQLVDPNDLQATLGADVSWKSMSIVLTKEPITSGIEQNLKWIGRMRSPGFNIDLPGVKDQNGLDAAISYSAFVSED